MSNIKSFFKSLPGIKSIYLNINNQNIRDEFVIGELKKIKSSLVILDAGCGSQRYRDYCSHLIYKAQDFGQYKTDLKKPIGSGHVTESDEYKYGQLDYVGDIWDIDEKDNTFDVILCTEVFEHIPFPIAAIKEFSRLLKIDGKLIITAPSNCLRHMDPYFFYSGFSDRWFEKFLKDNSLMEISITPVGDYYSWLAVQIASAASAHSILTKLLLLPSFFYFYSKKKTQNSIDALCMGYHVVAKKV